MKDSADPMQGWPIEEVIQKAPLAKNDIYGSLFYYLHNLLWQFCHQMDSLKINIQLFQVDALKLPSIFKQHGIGQYSFDRIEVQLSSFSFLDYLY